MGTASLLEKVKQETLADIHGHINASHDPTLTRTVLFTSASRTLYTGNASEELEVEQGRLDSAINSLLKKGIIRLEDKGVTPDLQDDILLTPAEMLEEAYGNKQICPDELVKEYFQSKMPFGPHEIIDGLEISSEKAQEVMKAVNDLVSWNYTRGFGFSDLTKLRQLRQQSHQALEPIREQEREFWYTELEIPRQFTGIPSFVREADPTINQEYPSDIKSFTLNAKFDSIDEAFETGFDEVHGFPITKKPYKDFQSLPRAVKLSKNRKTKEYKLTLTNIAKDAHWGTYDKTPYDYKKEAEEIMPVLRGRLDALVDQSLLSPA